MSVRKSYLGDAVYIDHDGFGLVLTTEDGYRATNTIHLEPLAWSAMKEYVTDLEKSLELEKSSNDKSKG